MFGCSEKKAPPRVDEAGGISFSSEEISYVTKKKAVYIGASSSFPPYIIDKPDADVSGYDADILDLVAQKTGLEIHIIAGKWDEMVEKARNGEIDGLSTTIPHEERRQFFNFSLPYISTRDILFVQGGNPLGFSDLPDLEGRRGGVEEGNLQYEKKTFACGGEIRFYPTMNDVVRALFSDEIDFFICDQSVLYIIDSMGLDGFIEPLLYIKGDSDFVFSLDRNQPELTSLFDKAIAAITDEEKTGLVNRWFGYLEDLSGRLSLTGEEKYYIEENPFVVLAGDVSHEPWFIEDNGSVKGIVRRICDILEERTGLTIRIVAGSREEQRIRLEEGKIDGYADISSHSSLGEAFIVSEPYYSDPDVIFVPRGNPRGIVRFDQLKGLKGGTVEVNPRFREMIKSYSPSEEFLYSGCSSMIHGLAGGEVDYILASESVLHIPSAEDLLLKIEPAFFPDTRNDMSIAVKSENPVLHRILNKALASISAREMDSLIALETKD
ncbi:MAG: transporter substrate-binding domain-containing protein [Spirochaetales bacterium]|nr:transporter substrate-binding domain-containing protein [Spirochaetales bacterium]